MSEARGLKFYVNPPPEILPEFLEASLGPDHQPHDLVGAGLSNPPLAGFAAANGGRRATCYCDSQPAGAGLRRLLLREGEMAVASVSKITASSTESFESAVREGLARASKTLRGITGLHVVEQKASVNAGKIAEYRVTMEVTFVLDN